MTTENKSQRMLLDVLIAEIKSQKPGWYARDDFITLLRTYKEKLIDCDKESYTLRKKE